MHEYSVTKNIVNIVNNAAAARGAARVKTVFLVIGESTCVIPDCVQIYYGMIARGTASEGAAINVRVVKPEMYCPVCLKTYHRPRFSFDCPTCGTAGSPTEAGNELYVERVELEVI